MALRLNDIKVSKKTAKVPPPSQFQEDVYDSVVQNLSEKEKLRPWQSQEDHQDGPRTYAAKEAVARAKERARLNEELAAGLRQGFAEEGVDQRLRQEALEREKIFEFAQQVSQQHERKIRVSSPFVKFFRDLLRQ